MKRLVVIVCFCVCISASGQKVPDAEAYISLDMASLIMSGETRLEFGHSFAEKWSAEGRAAVRIPKLHKTTDEEMEHGELLSGTDGNSQRTIESLRPEVCFGIRFWPRRFHEGTYLGLGCSHNMESGADMNIGIGYSCRIQKCLGISIGYEIGIIDSLDSGFFGTEGIKVYIIHLF